MGWEVSFLPLTLPMREREREREPLGGGMGILTSPVLHSLISAAKSAISIFMERGTPPPFWASHALSEFCVMKKKEIFYFFL
jgi:CBS-domain-containing membrane protein